MNEKENYDMKHGNRMNDNENCAMKNGRKVGSLMVEDEGGDINERAEAFIKNFHNHLKIQRDESFKRYKEMITRGT